MKRPGLSRRSLLLAVSGLFVAVLLGVALGSGGDETPAPPAVLNRIAHKNENAAIEAAARMKAESEAASRAADARQDAADAAAPAEGGNGQAAR
jgi:hypothetical protein